MSHSIATSVVPFSFDHFTVRAINRDGEIWFVAADVCAAIDLGTEQIRRLDDDEKGLHLTQTPGGKQEMSIINESGLYALILRSRKPEAKRFRKWVTSEVLPAIRKTGHYNKPEMDFTHADAIASARQIALQYFDDFRKAVRDGTDTPTMDIPADVLAGMLAGSLWRHRFVLDFTYEGKMRISPMPDIFESVLKAIAAPYNGLKDQVIEEIGHACLKALAYRARLK